MTPDELAALTERPEPGPHRMTITIDGRAVETLADLPPGCVARVRVLHDELVAPLRSAVEDLGVPDAALVTGLIFGAISSAVQLVDHGHDLARTTAGTLAFVDAGLAAAH